jgi:hypothetical protein
MSSNCKYSILMPYHKRSQQLESTLKSFHHHYQSRNDYEVIIIEDRKNYGDYNEHSALLSILHQYKDVRCRVILRESDSCNPASAFNQGAALALGQYLIITNPECVHQVDILGELDKQFEENPYCYVVCSCLAIKDTHIRMSRICDVKGVWYQHSVHRNALCHFCSVISAQQFKSIDGFDEEYDKGMCFEDDDFRNTIQQAGIEIIPMDNLVTVHLSHSKSKPPNYLKLYLVNKAYYEKKWGRDSMRAEKMSVEKGQNY